MGMTLLEYAKGLDATSVRRAVIEMFAEDPLLRILPFTSIPGGAYQYSLEAKLPDVAFRGINETYTPSAGIINPQVEALRIAGGYLDVDRALVKMYGPDRRSQEERMQVKALSNAFGARVIKGDSESNPREFDGIQKRVTGPQLITNSTASGGAGLSLEKLDEAIDQTDDATHIALPKAIRRRMSAAARDTSVGGNITFELDEFGRQMTRYNGLPLVELESLTFTEAASNPSGATSTSIYVLSVGDGKVSGIQNGEMEVEDFGELQTDPVFRTRVEWLASLLVEHGRAITRLYSVNNLAVTK